MSRQRLPRGWVVRDTATGVGAIMLLAGSVALAVILRSPADPRASEAATDVVPLDQVYKFDEAGELPLEGRADLPVTPGSIATHWYTFRGWDVVVFEGLDLEGSGAVCLGVSALNAATHQIEHLSSSPTAAGACETAGAGRVVIASGERGVRVCGNVVSYITAIPAETTGVLYASLTAFQTGGTGVGISSRLETTAGPTAELDASSVSCGPLPVARAIPPKALTSGPVVIATPAAASTGSIAAVNRAPPPNPTRPIRCAPVEQGGLHEVTDSEAAPYLIHRPRSGGSSAPTVVFLSGGSGGRASAERAWDIVFAGRPRADHFQVVIPYSLDVNFIDEAPRTLAIVDEVLACYGGDPREVHLAGTSNGGLAAFGLMAAHPEYFASLLGAPGAFPVQDPTTIDPVVLGRALAGRAVFNGVGARDGAWKPEVIATHNVLVGAGIESVFVEFSGEGHVLSATLDPRALFGFWEGH